MAKLYLNQLDAHLKRAIVPVYLVSGDEHQLIMDATCAIRHALKRQGFHERTRFDVNTSFDANVLFEACQSLSLFSEKRLIELHSSGKWPDSVKKAMVALLKQPSDDVVIMMISPKLDASNSRSQWVKAVSDTGHWLPLWPLKQAQLSRYLHEKFASYTMSCSDDAMALLIEQTEGNLMASVQEIDKLALNYPKGHHVTAKALLQHIGSLARHTAFDVVDKMLAGNSRSVLQSLQSLEAEGSEATLLLWSISKEVRQLLGIVNSLNQGQTVSQAMNKANVWKQKQGLVSTACKRLSQEQLLNALNHCAQIDRSIKGLNTQNTWSELTQLVLFLSGTPLLANT